jgi:Zinc-binding dehydrogenase
MTCIDVWWQPGDAREVLEVVERPPSRARTTPSAGRGRGPAGACTSTMLTLAGRSRHVLAEGRISPVAARTFPLSEAAAANALLESGTVIGNLVLLPERLRGPSS